MGSSGSKACCGSSASSSSSGHGSTRKGKSKGSRVFQSSCLGSRRHVSHLMVYDHGNKENEGNASSPNRGDLESSHGVKTECYDNLKFDSSDDIPSPVELHEWSDASITNTTSRTGSTSGPSASAHSLTSPARFLSRFSFIPGNVSFRLSRATSLGSSRSYPIPSPSLRMFNDDEEETHLPPRSSNGVVNGKRTQQTSNLLSTSLFKRTPTQCNEGSSASLQLHNASSDILDNNIGGSQANLPIQDPAQVGCSTRVEGHGNSRSPRMYSDVDSIDNRLLDRRTGAREPADRNVLFSRTLSVGRLRDRVLRQSSLSDLTFCPLQQGREGRESSHGSARRALAGETRVSEPEGSSLTSPTSAYSSSPMPGSLSDIQDHEVETSRSREARYHDLLEHRSNFLERRRRIRSQVRALQRLGSRFENLSGHERSCILSGQHRTGRCTCRASNRDPNLNDDTSARASISRIVMLAEALFEVLDEIHQQSVVLSSRPSVSSLGSVPAPNEVVESLPVKSYTKSQKHQSEETAQCYICLVEYEEGDCMRVLPCHHEFHKTCIDKWLKEIHRVCPLCRGDICRTDSLPAEN